MGRFVKRVYWISLVQLLLLIGTKSFSFVAIGGSKRSRRLLGLLASNLPDDRPYVELITPDDERDEFTEEDWMPHSEKIRIQEEKARIYAARVIEDMEASIEEVSLDRPPFVDAVDVEEAEERNRLLAERAIEEDEHMDGIPPSPFTDDEEEIISAMGGRSRMLGRREDGFLGDCTLEEIAMDYSIPICYLADVLCTWGVPIPLNPRDRLGDLVTGEQAFAILEAVYSLDVGQVQDRYSNQSLLTVCQDWDIDIQTAFEFAVKEGWSLPFGVQTCLRVEQEEELLRVHGVLFDRID